jgi:2-oxoglutarate dehydrogenase E1 component
MSEWDIFYGPNAGYALELYERYQRDPASVDAETRAIFERMRPLPDSAMNGVSGASNGSAHGATTTGAAPRSVTSSTTQEAARDVVKVVLAARMARSIREYGHLAAKIDPLGGAAPGDPMLDPATHGLTEEDLEALPAAIVWPTAGPEAGACRDALDRLRAIYCGGIGYDFDHVQNYVERNWLHESVEAGAHWEPLDVDEQRDLLERLSAVEGFERYLHTTFPGQKRFSIEGLDMLVPMLDELIRDAAETGAQEVLLGMAHRGRLNVLAHIFGKPYAAILSEFHLAPNKDLVPSEGSMGINYGWTGDVKYHLGARRTLREGVPATIQLTMANNPSHLEFVNPVVEGFTRAAQDTRSAPGAPVQNPDAAWAIVIHGDAAFPGEGVVAETLNLSRLPGYHTGGTIHLIANNQVGFTTEPNEGRSTLYAGDLAKGYEIPILHVNADDPTACLAAVRLARMYRQRFHRDFLIDLIGYRRWGHNEGDEPAFTQPLLYERIAAHPTVRALYANELIASGVITPDEAGKLLRAAEGKLRQAAEEIKMGRYQPEQATLRESSPLSSYRTAIAAATLRELNAALLARPGGFTPHAKLEKLLQRRGDALDRERGIDWAHAESLAFAAILAEGAPIRLSGQDTERGTFSQRHLVLHDANTGARYVPLQAISQARASFAVYNSPLSEAAVIGFEYGYSVHAREALVLWEAQFGDFANAGQPMIDQFLVAARAKWRQHPSLTLLLPHGYEGQGPEHSSGRIERYLQLAAENNLRIANCTTAAQYFHLLRAQAASLRDSPRPLVLFTPKSLLRNPLAASSLRDLAEGQFRPALADALERDLSAVERNQNRRLILCSGKVAVDLVGAAQKQPAMAQVVAVARVEQLYPFPEREIERLFASYRNAREIVWLQEEPRNMGAWSYVEPQLRAMLPASATLRYIGRPARASVAEGDAETHLREQARILDEAFD